MSMYELPIFGSLDLEDVEEYYDATIQYQGRDVELDLNFEEMEIDGRLLDPVKDFLERFAEIEGKNRGYIETNFRAEGSSMVRDHLLLQVEGREETAEQLLQKLYLVRVGLYPEDEADFAVFDYSIGPDLTDQLVVVSINKKGALSYVTTER